MLENLRMEFQDEKRDLTEKMEQVKKKFEAKEDELTHKKIEFEREQAL
jgi:hypothetical protein